MRCCSIIGFVAAASLLCGFAATSRASVIFSQTFADSSNGLLSGEVAGGTYQPADDFTLSSDATIRSATWRGSYFGRDPITFPMSFTLFLYGDTDSDGVHLPDLGNVLASTSVNFASATDVTDTGLVLKPIGSDVPGTVYQFQADLPATALEGGKAYWFSVLGDPAENSADAWHWLFDRTSAPTAAFLAGGSNFTSFQGDFYMILDDASIARPAGDTVPSPGTMALMSIAGLLLLTRRVTAKSKI